MLIVALVCLPTRAASPQASESDIEPWLPPGTEIVFKESDTALLAGDWLVPSPGSLSFLIEAVQGERLLVASHDKSRRGWVRRDQVIPYDQALEYFTREIARSPHNDDAYWMRARLWASRGADERAIADLDQAIQVQPARAPYYLQRSLLQLRRQQLNAALADSDKAIQLDSKSSGAYVIRARIWLSKNDSGRAGADLDAAIRLDPSNRPPRQAQPATLVLASARRLAGGEEPPRGDEDQAPGPEPKTAVDLVARGLTWIEQQEYDKAVDDAWAALRLDPNYAPAYACRARAWAAKHRLDREADDYTEAIRLDPGNAGYRLARANSWSSQGRHEQAIADYADAIRAQPENPAFYVARGNEWRRHLKLDAALADYEHAIQLDRNYLTAYINHALVWKQRRAFDRAVFELTELIRRAPDHAEAHRTLARILATCNLEAIRDGNRALAEATRACELTEWRDPDCLDTLATAYAELGEYPAAIQAQTRAIQLLRENVPSALKRAMDFGGRRGVSFEARLAFYKAKKPCRE
jgi:tetratricopeptide (TPR) repeat protein